MVLLHCNPFDHRVWAYQIAHFSTWFKVIAPDLRGYGRTDKVIEPYSVADCCADVLGVMAAEKITAKTVLMGCSIGSVLTLRLGHDRPELFSALIGVGAAAPAKDRGPNDPQVKAYRETPFPASWRRHMEKTVSAGFVATPRGRYFLDLFEAWAPNMKAEGIVKLLQARAPENLLPLLPEISLPTLIVNGEHDTAFEGGKQTASLIPGAERYVLPNTGHACMVEDPAGFDAAVIKFLAARGLMPKATA